MQSRGCRSLKQHGAASSFELGGQQVRGISPELARQNLGSRSRTYQLGFIDTL
jgi:hypothetical protein